jgi:hypothetical protein
LPGLFIRESLNGTGKGLIASILKKLKIFFASQPDFKELVEPGAWCEGKNFHELVGGKTKNFRQYIFFDHAFLKSFQ